MNVSYDVRERTMYVSRYAITRSATRVGLIVLYSESKAIRQHGLASLMIDRCLSHSKTVHDRLVNSSALLAASIYFSQMEVTLQILARRM